MRKLSRVSRRICLISSNLPHGLEGLQSKGSSTHVTAGENVASFIALSRVTVCHHTATQRQLGRQGVNNNAVVQFMLHVLHVCEAGRLISRPPCLRTTSQRQKAACWCFGQYGDLSKKKPALSYIVP